MQFQIKCSTLIRLASICSFFEPTVPEQTREKINTIRLEAQNGKLLAIVTNQKIAVIELIGSVDVNLKGFTHLKLDPVLIAQCKAEALIGSHLIINTIPEMASAFAQTSSGWVYAGNPCLWFDETPLNDWRDWMPDEVSKKTTGAMYWNLFQVQSLVESSPTGEVCFPQFIDVSKPVILRDIHDSNWLGFFIPKPYDGSKSPSASLPEWLRA